MLTVLVLAMLAPQTSRLDAASPPLPREASIESLSWEPNPLPRASTAQHVTAKTLQLGGANVVGAGGAAAGGIASILPGVIMTTRDSGNVPVAIVLCGMAGGYSIGAALAIHASGRHVTGVRGSLLMTALGTGAGVILTGAALATGAFSVDQAIAAAMLVPPLTGILMFELSKDGPSVRFPVPQDAIAILATGAVGISGFAAYQLTRDVPVRVPLMHVRW